MLWRQSIPVNSKSMCKFQSYELHIVKGQKQATEAGAERPKRGMIDYENWEWEGTDQWNIVGHGAQCFHFIWLALIIPWRICTKVSIPGGWDLWRPSLSLTDTMRNFCLVTKKISIFQLFFPLFPKAIPKS